MTPSWRPASAGDATRGAAGDDLPTILYIGGSGRSGTTLLDRMLGQVPGMWSTGELARIWDSGLDDNRLCGCGEPFSECPFWREVGDTAFGGWSSLDLAEVRAAQGTVRRHRYIPYVISGVQPAEFRREFELFSSVTVDLYRAIRAVTGCDVLVDSTKEAGYAFILRRIAPDQLRLVHLLRHVGGVAYSWTKTVRMPDVTTGDVTLPRYDPLRMAVRWVGYNALFDAMAAMGTPSLLVHYEDFVADPGPTLASIVEYARGVVQDDDVAFLDADSASLSTAHTVAGNPMRFNDGKIRLKIDDEWRVRLPRSRRVAVSTLAAPGLLRYGYLKSTRRRRR